MDCAEAGALICVLFAVAPAAPPAPTGAFASPRAIRVVVDDDYVPYTFRSPEGVLQGIGIDQWRAWERKSGIKADIQALDWAEAVEGMRAGRFDVIDDIVETADRRQYLEFTPSYTTVETAIFFRDGISGITDVSSLKGFPVGVKAGDQHIDRLRENGVTAVIPFRNFTEMVTAAKERKINVFVADVPAALYLLHKIGIENEFRHSPPISRDEIRRAVRKGDAATLRAVTEGFAAIEPSELARIDERWFGRTIDHYERYLEYVGWVAGAAFLLILGLLAWNRALSRKILQRTAALRESEQRFRQIAENIREVFWLMTSDFKQVLYVSPAYEAVWGRPREALYRDPRVAAVIHPDDRSRVIEAMEGGRERGFEVEYRVVRPDGSVRWIRDRGFPIKDQAASVYRLAGIAEDLTERKASAEAVRLAEERFRLIIDTLPVMVWGLRPDGNLHFVNQRWIEYTGISFEEALLRPNDIVHPDDLPRVMERWLPDMAAGRPSEDEMRLRKAGGEYRWFLVRTVPLRDERGAIVNWYGTSTDIEDRKRAEEKLKASESQLSEAQRLAHIGSWEWDLRAQTGTWSDECYRIFGYPPGEPGYYEKSMARIHPADLDRLLDLRKRAIEHSDRFVAEFRILPRGDGERTLRTVGYVLRDAAGAPLRLVGTTQDVTELKRAEEELKETSEQLRALSASQQSAREEERIRIAREIHDELGATVTSLRWELESIKKSLSESARTPAVADLKEKLTGMLDLTDAMVDTVRRIASDLRPVVLDVLGLEEAIEWQAQQFADRTGIAVHCESPDTGVELTPAQSTAVFRIFQEALTNVLRHARATRVDVTVVDDSGVLVLMVADNGRGIRESERTGEMSIGLLGMRERVHLIGGEIDVSGVKDEGTTVTVRVPIMEG